MAEFSPSLVPASEYKQLGIGCEVDGGHLRHMTLKRMKVNIWNNNPIGKMGMYVFNSLGSYLGLFCLLVDFVYLSAA